jgi:hypothetical protein
VERSLDGYEAKDDAQATTGTRPVVAAKTKQLNPQS